MTNAASLEIGAQAITPAAFASAIRDGARLAFGAGVPAALAAARAVVDRSAVSGAAVYGLTTGLGAGVDTRLDPAELATFQRHAVLARAVGIGAPMADEDVRASMAARLLGLAQAGSGISPAVADAYLAAYNLVYVLPLAAIVGGHVTCGVSGLGEFEAQIKAGELRAIGISSGERLPGLDAPTLKESGVDVELANWRGVFGAGELADADKAALLAAVDQMAKSDGWKQTLATKGWMDTYLAGDDFAAYLTEEEARVTTVLKEIGLVS